MNLFDLRGFVPWSHLISAVEQREELIGRSFKLKFLEVNRETRKLVLSNRRAVTETMMEEIKTGDLVDGVVSATKPYGAFVELANGSTGLLHVS